MVVFDLLALDGDRRRFAALNAAPLPQRDALGGGGYAEVGGALVARLGTAQIAFVLAGVSADVHSDACIRARRYPADS